MSCMGNDNAVDILLKIHQHLRCLLGITVFLIAIVITKNGILDFLQCNLF